MDKSIWFWLNAAWNFACLAILTLINLALSSFVYSFKILGFNSCFLNIFNESSRSIFLIVLVKIYLKFGAFKSDFR